MLPSGKGDNEGQPAPPRLIYLFLCSEDEEEQQRRYSWKRNISCCNKPAIKRAMSPTFPEDTCSYHPGKRRILSSPSGWIWLAFPRLVPDNP